MFSMKKLFLLAIGWLVSVNITAQQNGKVFSPTGNQRFAHVKTTNKFIVASTIDNLDNSRTTKSYYVFDKEGNLTKEIIGTRNSYISNIIPLELSNNYLKFTEESGINGNILSKCDLTTDKEFWNIMTGQRDYTVSKNENYICPIHNGEDDIKNEFHVIDINNGIELELSYRFHYYYAAWFDNERVVLAVAPDEDNDLYSPNNLKLILYNIKTDQVEKQNEISLNQKKLFVQSGNFPFINVLESGEIIFVCFDEDYKEWFVRLDSNFNVIWFNEAYNLFKLENGSEVHYLAKKSSKILEIDVNTGKLIETPFAQKCEQLMQNNTRIISLYLNKDCAIILQNDSLLRRKIN